ncbi:hypothetical protein Pcinc_039481 [Petrolisthes cinctipes]|uniref:ZSWIM3 N-terminal domain-containing protein n=1 Tax=Petrolisthes cinctipes TaxID=88211 RepID=A0AAE1EJ48_PETCI|nr:hypothetical protein Pcinc_039481 [Petrolisthes cinctipes]
MLKVGSKFYTFDELSKRLEEFQELERVQLWVRDSRTVVAAAKRARRKSLNPALKYAELTYSCVFGGRRPSDQTKIHNQTSAGGCPFKVRLSTSNDGQALVVKEICHDHNHEPGKKLHEEPRRLYKKTQSRTTVRKPVRYIVNKQQQQQQRANNNNKTTKSTSSSNRSDQQQQQQLESTTTTTAATTTTTHVVEVIQLDSPDHIDTPDHLRGSPDLVSTSYDQLGSLNNSVDQYAYLPPSPISPSLSSGCPVDCEEDERLEPILDLEEALEEALGDLDSVGSMDVDTSLRLANPNNIGGSIGDSQTNNNHNSNNNNDGATSDDSYTNTNNHTIANTTTDPPPAKRHRGRPRKQSLTGSMFENNNNNNSNTVMLDIPDLDFSLSDLMDFDVYLF